jgi:hypothetical protein
MKARQLAGSSEEFKAFTADMDEAVKAMGPAADKLRGSEWQNVRWRRSRKPCSICCAPKP